MSDITKGIVQQLYTNHFGTATAFDEHATELVRAYTDARGQAEEAGATPVHSHEVGKAAVHAALQQQHAAILPKITMETFKTNAKHRFIAAGGSIDEFNGAWPSIRASFLAGQASGDLGTHERRADASSWRSL